MFKTRINLNLLILAVFLLTGCGTGPDFDLYRQEILALHRTTINAHWQKDVDFFTRDIAEDYFSVNNGDIRHPSSPEISERFDKYLNNTTFSEYADLQEPIIGFSDDGSLAWSIVRVKIAGKRAYDDGIERDFDFICAWITLYHRENGRWIRMGEVSSFRES